MGSFGDLLRAKGFEHSGAPDTPPEPEPPPEPGARFAHRVVVRVSRKGRGGKTVTEIQGVLLERDETAKALKKALGVGAREEDELVVVQGDQRERVAAWLEQQGAKKVVRG
ncbi:MAG: translation initiation factor [Myxococcales bacterium]|nr:translation initiation factor [Myxococcales bacterium]MCB9671345.1 translation initiation factor [Alphaproteobacteria bacterium]MCB9673071.1 translation initiation factor [Alphaproteobacteria bacterium]MCB9694959.1 translation initiation factor [Alphaproteobacteria bacterium]